MSCSTIKNYIHNLHFESDRLITQRLTEKDAPTLLDIYSDEEAMKFRGSAPLNNLKEASEMISNQLVVEHGVSKIRQGIRLRSNNKLIGTLLLVLDENFANQLEIGFSFGKKHWGNGYAQETLKMVEEVLSLCEHIQELKAWCIAENTASVSVFQKAEFLEMKQSEFPQSKLFLKNI